MPTYEYKCSECKIKREIIRSIHAGGVMQYCCGEPMARTWYPAPVVFNATGFYKTDNKRR